MDELWVVGFMRRGFLAPVSPAVAEGRDRAQITRLVSRGLEKGACPSCGQPADHRAANG